MGQNAPKSRTGMEPRQALDEIIIQEPNTTDLERNIRVQWSIFGNRDILFPPNGHTWQLASILYSPLLNIHYTGSNVLSPEHMIHFTNYKVESQGHPPCTYMYVHHNILIIEPLL